MSLFFAFGAALLAALNNLSMRKSIDAGGSSKGFLVSSMAFALFISVLLNPIKAGIYKGSLILSLIGLIAGLVLGVMMWSLGKALEKGPPGLTIAYLNASNVVPAVLMAFLFGAQFGFSYGPWNAIGSLLVIAGLFWAVWKTAKIIKSEAFWLTFATLSFMTHVLYLMMIQWRSLLIRSDLPSNQLIPFSFSAEEAIWFTPMIFLGALSFLYYRLKKEEARKVQVVEARYGLVGGSCIGLSTICLVHAAHIAKGLESAMIFPLFAVGIVLICNIWGKLLYQEKVHWKAMSLCLLGLFIGTIDWSSVFS